MQHFKAKIPLINMHQFPKHLYPTVQRFAAICFILTLVSSFKASAQSFSWKETQNITFLDKNDQDLVHAVCGGFNQAQFVSIDIDNDGTQDVMVFDRTGRKILPFIMESNGLRYAPQYEEYFPEFEAWVGGADFDGDNKMDLWFSKLGNIALYRNATLPSDKHVVFSRVSDELRGYNFNTEPNGIDTTSLYSTQFNQPAFADVDFDGDIDVFTLQPFGYGITLFLNSSKETGKPLSNPSFEEVDFCWADFEEGINNDTIFLRRNQYCFSANYRYLKKHSGGSSLLLFDKEDDGDMDLLIGNAGFNNLILLENGKSDFDKKKDTMISYDLNYPPSKPARLDLYPASFMLDVDNDGIKDLIVASSLADYSSGYTRETNQIWFYRNEGTNARPDFRHKKDDFLVGESVDYGGHAFPELYDIDGDGDLDLFLGTNGDYFNTHDSSDRIVFFRNVGSKSDPKFKEEDTDFLGLSSMGYMNLNFSLGNIDNDGVLDLLVGKVDGTIDFFNVARVGPSFTLVEKQLNAFGINVFETASPTLVDVNKDSLVDLLVGCFAGNIFYYQNTGTATAPVFSLEQDTFGHVIANGLYQTISGETGQDTMVHYYQGFSTPRFMDIDGDGNRELLSGSNDGTIKVFTMDGSLSDTFRQQNNLYYNSFTNRCVEKDFGARSSLALADLNNDGKMDMIVGNRRGGIHYLEGSDSNCTVAGIDNQTLDRLIVVYPNPTSDWIKIEVESGVKILGVEIYDIKGNKVLSQEGFVSELSLKNLSQGVYSLGIISQYGKSYKKIIKYH